MPIITRFLRIEFESFYFITVIPTKFGLMNEILVALQVWCNTMDSFERAPHTGSCICQFFPRSKILNFSISHIYLFLFFLVSLLTMLSDAYHIICRFKTWWKRYRLLKKVEHSGSSIWQFLIVSASFRFWQH